MDGLTIARLARHAGVGVETVRYYQRRGLLGTPPRPGPGAGSARRYGEGELRELRFIRSAQTAGFTLDEIAELRALDAREDRERARELAQARLAALDAQLEALRGVRDRLARLAQDCARADTGPCPILAAFADDPPKLSRSGR